MSPARDECLPALSSETRAWCSGPHRNKGSRRRQCSREGSDYSPNERGSWPPVGQDDAMNDLHIKLAHVQWRKHANDKNIRKAIDISRRMHKRDLLLQLSVDREGERELWTKAIVRDELARPAEISEMFLKSWEQREDDIRERRLKEAKLHLRSIKRVERAVTSKTSGKSPRSPDDLYFPDGEESRRSEDYGTDSTLALKDKLCALRSGVKEERRDLRRAIRRGLEGSFSATNFKTGRGRC